MLRTRVFAVACLPTALLGWTCAAHSQQPAEVPAAKADRRTLSIDPLVLQHATQWGLNADEWSRYRELMDGPLGIQTPNLDPLTALGISARSDAERRRYAEMQVRVEAARVERLLAYQRAYDDAWKRLYPALTAVKASEIARDVKLPQRPAPSRRLAVFVKEGCPPCDSRVKQLQRAGKAFDIYVVGSTRDDARIRRWAQSLPIDPLSVRSGKITLNHDAGRWVAIGGTGSLPATGYEANGEWQPE